jgi:eukaryotic translation initiation factor 2C
MPSVQTPRARNADPAARHELLHIRLIPGFLLFSSRSITSFSVIAPQSHTCTPLYPSKLCYHISVNMSALNNPRFFQDLNTYRPRNANISVAGIDLDQEKNPHALPQRPKNFNTYGKETSIMLNTFNILKTPETIVHQYDVNFTGDAADYTKRVLLKKIFKSLGVSQALGEPANLWIWDGNKLAWSSKKLDRDDTRITVDLDDEEGRPTKPGQRGNKHTIHLRHTRKVDFANLQSFLAGQVSWSNECIDTVNFLDHCMREWPSQRYTQIKKSFFQRGEQRFDLGGGVEAFKGVFASLRPVLDDKFNKSLSVNVDVANGTFWRAQELTRAVGESSIHL